MELPIDEIIRSRDDAQAFDPCRTWQASDSNSSHQDGEGSAGAGDARADGEFGVDLSVAVGPTGDDVDLSDQPAHQRRRSSVAPVRRIRYL